MRYSRFSFRLAPVAVLLASVGCFGGYGAIGRPDPQSAPPCPPLQELFSGQIEPFMEETCLPCHRGGGAAEGTGLVLQQGDVAANFISVEGIAKESGSDGTSLLLAKPTAHVQHGGGLRLDDASSTYQAFAQFAARVRRQPATCVELQPGP